MRHYGAAVRISLVVVACVLPGASSLLGVTSAQAATGQDIPAEIAQALARDGAVDVLARFDVAALDAQVEAERRRRGLEFDDPVTLRTRMGGYAAIKLRALRDAGIPVADQLTDLSALSLAHLRIRDRAALDALRSHASVLEIMPNRRRLPTLDAVSAGLVAQPVVQGQGLVGAGTGVAIIDSGADYQHVDLGSCFSPGVPASCKVVYYANFADSSTVRDASASHHGTNVAAIVAGVAPGARLAILNVFGASSTALDSNVLAAMNWAVVNQATYNIRAINMSLGDGGYYTSPCSAGNPYVSAVTSARNAGILTVVSAGNGAHADGLSSPACTPNAISVGAVYSQNWGAVTASTCSDAIASADKVACFSNSASFLTMLAPGAFITAGGVQLGGTSQAAPFVAGAVALARAAYPADTLDQTLARLSTQAVNVTDARNGLVKPRLQLAFALRPVNDDFARRSTLSGNSGTATGSTSYGTAESGEPAHASAAGGHSIWWRWVAPATGQVTLDTHGSGFDTVLAVYTGSGVGALSAVASNDNDGFAGGASGVLFQATAGVEYQIAVDGAAGGSGAVALHWSLNIAAAANLAAGLGVTPSTTSVLQPITLYPSVQNLGPQSATGVAATLTLPPGWQVQPGPACTVTGQVATCRAAQLAALTSRTWSVTAIAATPAAGSAVLVAASDLPDPSSANDTASQPLSAQSDVNADVPLPAWALVGLAGLLMGSIGRRRR